MKRNKLIQIVVVGLITITTFIGCTHNDENSSIENNMIKKVEQDNIDKYDPIIMLVNNEYWIYEDFVPNNLKKVNINFSGSSSNEEMHMEYEAAEALERLINSALNDGIELYGVSGYRSYSLQQHVYDKSIENRGQDYTNDYVAIPGRSEHQIGLAMDLGDSTGNLIENELETEWVEKNSYLHGFIIRYPDNKKDITGYNYEPWHIRYVGVDVATEIYNKNITLEEYCEY